MLYSDFIKETLTNTNGINWNYYDLEMPVENILQANQSHDFIRKYFKNGGKELPLLLDPAEITDFLDIYSFDGFMKSALSFDYKEKYILPNDRAIHTVSGFFLGLLIEYCLNGENTLAIDDTYKFPFAYLWFLMFLYHDYGYCVTERENSPITIPEYAPIPDMNNSTRIHLKEYYALRQIKMKMGINLSLFSSYPEKLNRMENLRHNYLERVWLRELTQRIYTVTGPSRIRFNTGMEILGHQYTSTITTRYFNYCINERGIVDHGIVGGYLFYDRMIKNYLLSYMKASYEREYPCILNDYSYNSKHFCTEQLPIFSYIADCILAHNIWKQPIDKRFTYEQYRLDALFVENFKNITFQDNPLLYILVVTDSLEPTKVYREHLPLKVSNSINIDFLPGNRALTFSSRTREVPIETLYYKAKGLEDWTSIYCDELSEGKFILHI